MKSIETLRIEDLQLVLKAAETGSLSAVARQLGLPRSNVSRRIAQIEEQLGARLFHRTTRQLQPTYAGARICSALDESLPLVLKQLGSVSEARNSLSGRLRIKIPVEGVAFLEKGLSEFTLIAPEVHLDIRVSNRNLDLVQHGLDVSLEFGPLADTAYHAKPIARYQRLVVAAPSYIREHGEPTTRRALKRHKFLLQRRPNGDIEKTWPLEGSRQPLDVSGTIIIDNETALKDLAVGGLGIALLGNLVCREALEEGQLVQCGSLQEVERTIYAVYPTKSLMPEALKVFLEFLVDVSPKILPDQS